MFNRKTLPIIFALCLLLSACGTPVPEDKIAYVGEWKAPQMYLLITKDGSVAYERLKGGATVSVNGPLQKFDGDNFIVGISFLATTFEVSRPPYEDSSSHWTMVVDGVELTKTN
jgi:hypothetical protein